MDIGKKIKEIRVGKLMTQSQLAGDEITRNMLSRIENGAALPSLGTVMYLAKRLGVPAGVLLSDDDGGEYNFKKSSLIKKIKDSFARKEYELCLDMCVESAAEADDEICYIACLCSVKLAENDLILGELYYARSLLEGAISYSEKTVYDTSAALAQVSVMLDFMRDISPMLDIDAAGVDIPYHRARMMSSESSFCRYINVIWEIENQEFDRADVYIDEEAESGDKYSFFYTKHIEAKLKMRDGDYDAALGILRSILAFDGMTLKLLIYLISSDIEICCRETEDFRGAYEFSGTKLSLIESMLRGGV